MSGVVTECHGGLMSLGHRFFVGAELICIGCRALHLGQTVSEPGCGQGNWVTLPPGSWSPGSGSEVTETAARPGAELPWDLGPNSFMVITA